MAKSKSIFAFDAGEVGPSPPQGKGRRKSNFQVPALDMEAVHLSNHNGAIASENSPLAKNLGGYAHIPVRLLPKPDTTSEEVPQFSIQQEEPPSPWYGGRSHRLKPLGDSLPNGTIEGSKTVRIRNRKKKVGPLSQSYDETKKAVKSQASMELPPIASKAASVVSSLEREKARRERKSSDMTTNALKVQVAMERKARAHRMARKGSLYMAFYEENMKDVDHLMGPLTPKLQRAGPDPLRSPANEKYEFPVPPSTILVPNTEIVKHDRTLSTKKPLRSVVFSQNAKDPVPPRRKPATLIGERELPTAMATPRSPKVSTPIRGLFSPRSPLNAKTPKASMTPRARKNILVRKRSIGQRLNSNFHFLPSLLDSIVDQDEDTGDFIFRCPRGDVLIPGTTFTSHLLKACKDAPNGRAAIVDGRTGQSMTFSELLESVLNIGGVLSNEYNVKKGDVVAMVSENSIEYVVVAYAVMMIGGVVGLLSQDNMKMGPLLKQLSAISPRYVYTSQKNFHLVKRLVQSSEIFANTVKKVYVGSGSRVSAGELTEKMVFISSMAKKESVCTVILSGSDTAALAFTRNSCYSSAVRLTHGNLVALSSQLGGVFAPSTSSSARVFHVGMPLSSAASALAIVPYSILTRGTAVLTSYDDTGMIMPPDLGKHEDIQYVFTTPNLLIDMLANEPSALSSAKCLFMCYEGQNIGSSTPVKALEKLRKHSSIRVVNVLSDPEAMLSLMTYNLDPKSAYDFGQAIPNMRFKILDQHGETCGIEENGTLAVGGPQVTSGYYDPAEHLKAQVAWDLKTRRMWQNTASSGANANNGIIIDEEGFVDTRIVAELDASGSVIITDRKDTSSEYLEDIENMEREVKAVMYVEDAIVVDELTAAVRQRRNVLVKFSKNTPLFNCDHADPLCPNIVISGVDPDFFPSVIRPSIFAIRNIFEGRGLPDTMLKWITVVKSMDPCD